MRDWVEDTGSGFLSCCLGKVGVFDGLSCNPLTIVGTPVGNIIGMLGATVLMLHTPEVRELLIVILFAPYKPLVSGLLIATLVFVMLHKLAVTVVLLLDTFTFIPFMAVEDTGLLTPILFICKPVVGGLLFTIV